MRCSECGFESPSQSERCGHCGAALPRAALPQAEMEDVANSRSRQLAPVFTTGLAAAPPPRQTQSSSPLQRRWLNSPAAVGTVIAVEPPYNEAPDLRLPVVLNRLLLLIEFLGLPILLLRWWMSFAGALSFLLGVGAIFLLFRYLMPMNLLSVLGIVRLLNPRREVGNRVPVRYLRLRTHAGSEVVVRGKGRIAGANLMPGDEVALWGATRHGTLHLRRAINLRTGAHTVIANGHPWIPLLLNVVILSLLIGLFLGPLLTIAQAGGGR